MKFKVGDIIRYTDISWHKMEVGREQVIKRIVNNKFYHTNFLDTGEWNSFDSPSNYEKMSILVEDWYSYSYDNGIPLIWEDEL
jgi:hypothetical protein